MKAVMTPIRMLVIAAAMLLVAASSAVALSGDTQVRPAAGLTVHDARGQLIGPVVDTYPGGSAVVVVNVGRMPVALVATRNGFSAPVGGTQEAIFAYESNDCSGQAWLQTDHGHAGPFPPVFLDENRLYSYAGSEQAIHVRAYRWPNGECGAWDAGEVVAARAELLADLGHRFVPPFTLRTS